MSLATQITALAQAVGAKCKALNTQDITGPAPVNLTNAATVTTDASKSTLFRVTITANTTLAAPTNPTDGQRCTWQVTASGGAWTLTLATGAAGAFKYGTDFTSIPAIASGTATFVAAIYDSTAARWHVLSVGSGH